MADDGGAPQGPQADSIFTVTKSIDPRTTQPGHTYCTAQGGSAISVVQLAAATQGNTNWTFSVVPPSTNVIIEKAPHLDVTLTFQLLFLQSDGSGINGNTLIAMDPNFKPFARFGPDFAMGRAAPLGQLVSSWTINFNNAACMQQNVALPDLTHVLEGPKGRGEHGTTFRIPVLASWNDADKSDWGLSAAAASMQGEGDCGPGVYNFVYCDGTGTPLPYRTTVDFYNPGTGPQGAGDLLAFGPNSTCFQYGVPVTNPLGGGALHAVYFQVRAIDTVVCSPWAINYATARRETGLYGLSTLTFLAQLQAASQARLIQGCSQNGCVLMTPSLLGPGATAINQAAPAGFNGASGDLMNTNGVTNCKIWMTYISPTIQSTLPPRSISTLLSLQYFQSNVVGAAQFRSTGNNNIASLNQSVVQGTVNFSAVSFSCVPDLIMISVRPDFKTQFSDEADFCCTYPDNMFPQFTFANQSGLFSGFTSHAMTNMSRANGSRASLMQYGGADGSGFAMLGGNAVAVGGSVLLIRPGWDFPLPVGVSVGSTGQVQIAFQLNFNAIGSNVVGAAVFNRTYVCTVTAISSGYFVTANGVSRQVLVGLDEVTVLNAPVAPDRFAAQKLAGGSFMNGLSAHGNAGTEFLSGLKDQVSRAGSSGVTGGSMQSRLAQRARAAHMAWSQSRASTAGNGVSGGAMSAASATGMGIGAGNKRRLSLSQRLQEEDGY